MMSSFRIRFAIGFVLAVFFCPAALADPYIGAIPVQPVVGGDTFMLDMSRFYEPDAGSTLSVETSKDYTASFDPDSVRLSIYVPPTRVGLIDIPVEIRDARGRHRISSVITAVVSHRERHRFSYKPSSKPKKLVAAGSFNGWNQDKTVLRDPDGDGVYEADILLEPGTYLYKFVADGTWLSDPGNPNKSEDGFGGYNSIIAVEGPGGGTPPSLYPDTINGTDAQIRIIEGSDSIGDISVVVESPNGNAVAGKFVRLDRTIRIPARSVPKGAWVRVIAADARGRAGNAVRFHWPAAAEFSWQDAILYFAFTDRFYNADRSNDTPAKAADMLRPGNFHGGDWKGIRQKIEEGYFDSIGVNVLWITPVNENPPDAYREFTAPYRLYTGYHGYWPISADRTDPHFGSADDLKALVSSAHAHGLKVITDLVVNHVHDSHPLWKQHPDWFAARRLPDGRENLRLWDEHPFTTWFDRFLPTFDFTNEEASRAMIENSAWWAREFDLDGFRLDAVKHVPQFFWRKLRTRLRETIEENAHRRLFMVGETYMSRESIMSFVGPNMLDGQFDFPLYDTVKSVFAQKNSGFADLEASLSSSERVYGKETLMSPLVGNHDKSRFMAYADGDLPDPKEKDEEEVGWVRPPRVNQEAAYDRLQMAMAFILSIDGVPMVYYGDEFGMTGAGDPDNRRDMRFDEQLSKDEQAMLDSFSRLTKIRRDHPALRYGHRRPLLVDNDKYAFVRAYFDDRVLVAFNRTDKLTNLALAVAPELPDGDYVRLVTGEALSVKGGRMDLRLGPRSAAFVVAGVGVKVEGRSETPASSPAYQSVGLAGTFNDWNPNDPAFRLDYAPSKSRWEIATLFQKGRYQFKFVMNGGWDVNRGMSDAGGLEQPGKDIPLDIPSTGYYKISYDPSAERWSADPSAPPSAIADVRVPAAGSLGRDIRLDASPSQAREGKIINTYTWTQIGPEEYTIEGLPSTSSDPILTIRPARPGIYRLRLSVDDGSPGVGKDIEIPVRPSVQIVGAPDGVLNMEPGPDGKMRALIPVRPDTPLSVRLMLNFDSAQMFGPKEPAKTDAEMQARVALVRAGKAVEISSIRPGVVEIRYDSTAGRLIVRRSNLTRFWFNPVWPSVPKDAAVEDVSVAGTFNSWDSAKNPLSARADGTYEAFLELPDGAHQYKFVVNGKTWITDPLSPADLSVADGHGGMNSGVYVGERGADFGPSQPNGILSAALRHDPSDLDDFNMVSKNQVSVRLRAREADAGGVVLIQRFARAPVKRRTMNKLYSKLGFDYYGATFGVPSGESRIEYIFELTDGSALVYHTPTANTHGLRSIDQTTQWFSHDLTPAFLTPDWAKNVVWYQIMLDRWRNGDPSNDPDRVVPWRWDWYKPNTPGEAAKFYGGDGVWGRFYGGDLAGLKASLDYLEDLGVTGIYLNPMFEASSYHKYNTADYRHIDDNFGEKGDVAKAQATEGADSSAWHFTPTDKLFLDFLQEAHRRGFKVIIDGVFNHSGTDFWAFRDLVKNMKKSPYKDWYVVRKWDVTPAGPGDPSFTYDGWAGFAGLPEYAENENGLLPGIRRHIFDITARWMDPNGDGNPSDGVDGWRLDVPENVNEHFWVDWRKLVKGVNPDAYITGEIWENAANRLRGRHYDAVMNYEFAKRVYGFFLPGGKTSAMSSAEFGRSLGEMQDWYLPQVNQVLQNLLDSHDADRIASAIHNRAGWKRGRIQDDNPDYDPSPPSSADYDVLKRIVAFQMTWIGAPMIYYGDEAGMFGADDPSNRMPMLWKDLMPYDNPGYVIRDDLLDHYKRMIAVRNAFSALRTGAARVIPIDSAKSVIAFQRSGEGSRVIVVIRTGNDPQSVKVPLEKASAAQFVDVADPANTEFDRGVVDGIGSNRPIIRIRPGARAVRAEGGGLSVSLRDRSWAILVEKK